MKDLDPFDLPDWLGTSAEVTWHAVAAEAAGHLVRGLLAAAEGELPCDLLAVDEAYPAPVADDDLRRRVHQAWRNGQVLLIEYDGRPTLAVPGTGLPVPRVLDALERLTKALGARPEQFVAALRLGVVRGGV